MSTHEHDDACLNALAKLQLFLHHELDELDEDAIRAHIDACEACLGQFDVEAAIAHLLRRCHPPTPAPSTLRMRVMRVHIRTETFDD